MHRLLPANTVLLCLSYSFSSPQDVDVYTGALSEAPLEGAIFGPLLSCLVSDQFMRLKLGDAHWYERKVGPQRFSRGENGSCNKYIYKVYILYSIDFNSNSFCSTTCGDLQEQPGGHHLPQLRWHSTSATTRHGTSKTEWQS